MIIIIVLLSIYVIQNILSIDIVLAQRFTYSTLLVALLANILYDGYYFCTVVGELGEGALRLREVCLAKFVLVSS